MTETGKNIFEFMSNNFMFSYPSLAKRSHVEESENVLIEISPVRLGSPNNINPITEKIRYIKI
jgi:hypothetical protein